MTTKDISQAVNEMSLTEKQTAINATRMIQIQELEHALDKDNNEYVLDLIVEVAMMHAGLPPELITRIIGYIIQGRNPNGVTPSFQTVHSQSVKQIFKGVRQLICYQTFNINTQEHSELVHKAITAGDAVIAMLLLQPSDYLYESSPVDTSNLFHEVLASYLLQNKEELVRFMLKHGVDVNASDSTGQSVLHTAIRYCSSELVEELLEHGAQVTISSENALDDLYMALQIKPKLLPILVGHEAVDETTMNKRGVIAIKHLISKPYSNNELTDALQLLQTILDLGVHVNTPDPFAEGEHPCSLLNRAMKLRNKDMIEMLLDYGANPNQKNEFGETPLYQAMILMDHTLALLLIQNGANIHARNNDGSLPIHAACKNEHYKQNISLLLDLGADLNVTNDRGCTPLDNVGQLSLTEAACLIVRHYALISAKGETINEKDRRNLNQHSYFKICIKELEKMIRTKICDDVSYFSLLSQNIYGMLELIEKPNFTVKFQANIDKLAMFFNYRNMLLYSFKIAVEGHKLSQTEPIRVQEAYEDILPHLVIDKIAHFSRLLAIENCRRDYFMSLHVKGIDTSKTGIFY